MVAFIFSSKILFSVVYKQACFFFSVGKVFFLCITANKMLRYASKLL